MTIQDTDYFVINREGVDYKATVDQFAKDIHIAVDAAGNQADWDELNANDPSYIKNKPDVNDGKLTVQNSDGDVVCEFTANQDGPSLLSLPSGFSGSYNDLSDKPDIPTDNADLANGAGYITLAEVPAPVVEGALIFKGAVSTEDDLPIEHDIGDFYHVLDNDVYYAWGEDDQWHNVGDATQINLDGYAQISGADFEGTVRVVNGDDRVEIFSDTVQVRTLTRTGGIFKDDYFKVSTDSTTFEVKVPETQVNAYGFTVTAKNFTAVLGKFTGDGSGLTNVPLPDFRTLTALS